VVVQKYFYTALSCIIVAAHAFGLIFCPLTTTITIFTKLSLFFLFIEVQSFVMSLIKCRQMITTRFSDIFIKDLFFKPYNLIFFANKDTVFQ
jgi:hypothetical protein